MLKKILREDIKKFEGLGWKKYQANPEKFGFNRNDNEYNYLINDNKEFVKLIELERDGSRIVEIIDEVKKCPFCGKEVKFDIETQLVHCITLDCAIGDFYIHIDEWNKRA